MKYIYANNEGIDKMEIETDGQRVVGVITLVPAADGATPDLTPEELQLDLDTYMTSPGSSIESALGNWAGGYSSIRRAEA